MGKKRKSDRDRSPDHSKKKKKKSKDEDPVKRFAKKERNNDSDERIKKKVKKERNNDSDERIKKKVKTERNDDSDERIKKKVKTERNGDSDERIKKKKKTERNDDSDERIKKKKKEKTRDRNGNDTKDELTDEILISIIIEKMKSMRFLFPNETAIKIDFAETVWNRLRSDPDGARKAMENQQFEFLLAEVLVVIKTKAGNPGFGTLDGIQLLILNIEECQNRMIKKMREWEQANARASRRNAKAAAAENFKPFLDNGGITNEEVIDPDDDCVLIGSNNDNSQNSSSESNRDPVPKQRKKKSVKNSSQEMSGGQPPMNASQKKDATRMNFQPAQASLPSAQASLPSAQASLPSAQASLPSAQASLPSAQASLPSAQASLPSTQTSLPSTQASLAPQFEPQRQTQAAAFQHSEANVSKQSAPDVLQTLFLLSGLRARLLETTNERLFGYKINAQEMESVNVGSSLNLLKDGYFVGLLSQVKTHLEQMDFGRDEIIIKGCQKNVEELLRSTQVEPLHPVNLPVIPTQAGNDWRSRDGLLIPMSTPLGLDIMPLTPIGSSPFDRFLPTPTVDPIGDVISSIVKSHFGRPIDLGSHMNEIKSKLADSVIRIKQEVVNRRRTRDVRQKRRIRKKRLPTDKQIMTILESAKLLNRKKLLRNQLLLLLYWIKKNKPRLGNFLSNVLFN